MSLPLLFNLIEVLMDIVSDLVLLKNHGFIRAQNVSVWSDAHHSHLVKFVYAVLMILMKSNQKILARTVTVDCLLNSRLMASLLVFI